MVSSGLWVWGEIARSALHTFADENVDPRLQQLVYDRQLALAQDISMLPFEATTNLEHIQRVTTHSDAPTRRGLEVHDGLRSIAQRDVMKSMCADLDFSRKVSSYHLTQPPPGSSSCTLAVVWQAERSVRFTLLLSNMIWLWLACGVMKPAIGAVAHHLIHECRYAISFPPQGVWQRVLKIHHLLTSQRVSGVLDLPEAVRYIEDAVDVTGSITKSSIVVFLTKEPFLFSGRILFSCSLFVFGDKPAKTVGWPPLPSL